MRVLKLASIVTTVVVFISANSFGQIFTQNLSANGDAAVNSGLPSNNYGATAVMKVRHDGAIGETYRAFMAFDFSSIPAGAIITDATLKVYASQVDGETDLDLFIERCDSLWEEDSLTWNNQPGAYFSDQVSIANSAVLATGYHNFDVSEHVQHFINFGISNNGWRIKLQDETLSGSYGISYASSEDVTNPPVLEVNYILPIDLQTSVTHCTAGNSDGQLLVNLSGGQSITQSKIRIHKVVRSGSQLGAASLSNVTTASNLVYSAATGTITAENLDPGVYRLRVYDDLYYSTGSDIRYRFYKYFLVGREGETTSGILLPSVSYQENVRIVTDKPTSSNPQNFANTNQSGFTNLYVSDLEDEYEYASLIQYYLDFDNQLEFTKADLSIKAANEFYRGTNSSNATNFSLVTSAWDEKTVTWNTRPTIDASTSINIPTTTIIGYDTLDLWDSLSILPFVEYWQQNPGQNNGFEMALENYNFTQYASRNYKGSSSNLNFIEFEFKLKSPDVTSATLSPIQDSKVASANPTTTYGSATTIDINYNAPIAAIDRGYVEFDLSSIPANALITDATLELYATSVIGSTGLDLYVQRADSLWWEDSIHWNNQSNVIATDQVSIPNSVVSVAGTQQFSVTDHVQEFVHYDHLNAGWRIGLQDETISGSYGVSYASSEHPNAVLRPQLKINYIMPVEMDFDITHCTPGNTDGSIDATISGGSGDYNYYWWAKFSETGGAPIVQHGSITDQSSMDISLLDPGLYLLRIRDEEWVLNNDDKFLFEQMVLVGREGETTTFTIALNENYSSDTRVTMQKDPTGDDWDNTNYGDGIYFISTYTGPQASGAKYDTKGLIQWPIFFDQELVFEDADLHLRTQYGHFRYGNATNESWLSRVTEPWVEDLVTWNTQPESTPTDRISLPETGGTGYTYEDYHVDILHFIDYWQENPTENYGLELALKDYNMDNTARLGFTTGAYSSKKPLLTLTYRVSSPVYASYDEVSELGSIEIEAPTAGTLPYRYVIDTDPIEDLQALWAEYQLVQLDTLIDSMLVDSTTFFHGNVNSTNFTFGNLRANRYYVSVFDDNSTKILDQEVSVSGAFDLVDESAILFEDGLWSRDTLDTLQSLGSILMDIPFDKSGGFEFEIIEVGDVIIGFLPSENNSGALLSDFSFGIHISDQGYMNTIIDGVEGVERIVTPVDSKIRLVKQGSLLVVYLNGIRVASKAYTASVGGSYKGGLILGQFVKLKPLFHFGYFKKVKPYLDIVYPECGELQGSFCIQLPFKGGILHSASLVGENGPVDPDLETPYCFSNIDIGIYTITVQYQLPGGLAIYNYIDQIAIGYVVNWIDINNSLLLPGTLNSITNGGSNSSLGSAYSNYTMDPDPHWVQFESRLYSTGSFEVFGAASNIYQQFRLVNGSGNNLPAGSTEFLLFLSDLQSSSPAVKIYDYLSGATNVLPNTYTHPNNTFRIEKSPSGIEVFDASNPTPIYLNSGPWLNNNDPYFIKIFQRGKPEFVKTITSYCYPSIPDQYVTPNRKIQGGYYLVPSDNLLRFEFFEEYSAAGEINFIVRDNMGQNTGLTATSLQNPTEIFGDNREELDVSALGTGVYIMEIINDKNEHWYLRFKVD